MHKVLHPNIAVYPRRRRRHRICDKPGIVENLGIVSGEDWRGGATFGGEAFENLRRARRLLSTLENQVRAVAIPLTGTLITAVICVMSPSRTPESD